MQEIGLKAMRGLAGPSRHPKARVPPRCPFDPRQHTCTAVSNHTTTSETHRRGAPVSQGAELGGQHAADAQAVAALQRAAGDGAGGRRPRWRRRQRGGRDEDAKPRPAHWQQPAQVAEHDASPRGPQGGLSRRRTCSEAPLKFKFRCVRNAGGLSAKMPQMWTKDWPAEARRQQTNGSRTAVWGRLRHSRGRGSRCCTLAGMPVEAQRRLSAVCRSSRCTASSGSGFSPAEGDKDMRSGGAAGFNRIRLHSCTPACRGHAVHAGG